LIIQKEYSNYDEWSSLWTIKCISKQYKYLKNRLNSTNCPKNKFSRYNLEDSLKLNIYKGEKAGDFTLNDIITMYFSKLEDFTNKAIFVEKFMILCKMLENILYGIILLNSKKFVHYDINSNNIVINQNKSKLIDFGFIFHYNKDIEYDLNGVKYNLYADNQYKHFLRRTFKELGCLNNSTVSGLSAMTNRFYSPLCPFDLYKIVIQYNRLKSNKKVENLIIRLLKKDLKLSLNPYNWRKNYGIIKGINEFIFDRSNYHEELMMQIAESIEILSREKKYNHEKYLEVVKSVDIYSFATNIMYSLVNQLRKLLSSNDKYLSELELFAHDEWLKFIENIHSEKLYNIMKILKKCSHPNSKNRASANNKLYRDYRKCLREYFNKSKYKKRTKQKYN